VPAGEPRFASRHDDELGAAALHHARRAGSGGTGAGSVSGRRLGEWELADTLHRCCQLLLGEGHRVCAAGGAGALLLPRRRSTICRVARLPPRLLLRLLCLLYLPRLAGSQGFAHKRWAVALGRLQLSAQDAVRHKVLGHK
jgi:hypothetical protein